MTATRAEFLRILAGAVGADFDRCEGAAETVLTERAGPRRWRIRLSPLPPLRLGALSMERLEVELAFEGYGEEAEEAFIAGFMRHAQRGGG
jgi:hypothetical protein